MSKDELKKVSVEVSKECWRKLKMLSLQNDITFHEQVRDILEKSIRNKKVQEVEVNS